MGHFLAVSAFRDVGPNELVLAIRSYLADHGVAISPADGGPVESGLVRVFERQDEWTTVLWPTYFNVHDIPACQSLSASLGTLVSTASIYENDGWQHSLLHQGRWIDRFNSYPANMVWEWSELPAMARAWAGDPRVVAEAFDVPEAEVARYYRQVPLREIRPDRSAAGRIARAVGLVRSLRPGRGAAEDGPDPGDPWGFVDLWRFLGITYPDPGGHVGVVATFALEEDWAKRLPTNPA